MSKESQIMKNAPLFCGVCTALVTPFSMGKVNYEVLEELLDMQMEQGIPAVCVCGTTGEAPTLTDEEHLSIIQCAVKHCKGKMKIIAGTGSNNTSHSVFLSRQAEDAGADAVLVVTPYYNKASETGLIKHYSVIADSTNLPVVLYNVPSRTGVDISVAVCTELSKHENIVGIKEASGNVSKTSRVLKNAAEGFCVWSGNDDEITAQMSVGAAGIISVFSNLCPKEANAIANACISGKFSQAAELQKNYIDLIDALFSQVNPIPIKEAMELVGLRVGSPRLPLCRMDAACRNKLVSVMRAHGLI